MQYGPPFVHDNGYNGKNVPPNPNHSFPPTQPRRTVWDNIALYHQREEKLDQVIIIMSVLS